MGKKLSASTQKKLNQLRREEALRQSGRKQSSSPSRSYMMQLQKQAREERDAQMKAALALRSFHLPGYDGWWQDWFQYVVQNNHPLLGICCHHPLHPIGTGMRVVFLIGSVVLGLVVTNFTWLWYFNHEDQTLLTVDMSDLGNATAEATGWKKAQALTYEPITITQSMLLLWTAGSALHALFDNTIWHITACVCCLPGQPLSCLERCRKLGTYLVIVAVVIMTAIATMVVVLRAALDAQELDQNVTDTVESMGLLDDTIDLTGAVHDISAFDFLLSYGVELTLALLVYYPLVATIMFSGILGCYRIPVLGGRPQQMAREQRELDRSMTEIGGSSAHSSSRKSRPSIYLRDNSLQSLDNV